MANKGPLDTKIDIGALNEIIVFANQYRQEVKEKADAIEGICRTMAEEESLSGGDGEVIRENFAKIAAGCKNLNASTEKITAVLNNSLGTAIQMRHGSTIGGADEKMAKSTQKVGVLKE